MTSLGLEKKLTCDLVLEEDDMPFAHMFGIFFFFLKEICCGLQPDESVCRVRGNSGCHHQGNTEASWDT